MSFPMVLPIMVCDCWPKVDNVTFELFRTRLDALMASTLVKEIYHRKDTFDLNKLLPQFVPEGTDVNEWDQKCAAVQKK